MTDATDRKSALKKVQPQKLGLSTQLEASPDAILLVDGDERIHSCNRQFIDLWRIPTILLQAGLDDPIQQILASQQADPAACAARVRYLYEHRDVKCCDELHLKDGRFIERHSAPLLGKGGEYCGRAWHFRDISERRRAEDTQKLAASVHHVIGDAVVITDANSHILDVNPAFTELTGFSPEEAIGQHTVMLTSRRQDDLLYRKIAKGLEDTGRWKGQAWTCRKTGEEHLEWMEVYNVNDDNGQVLRRIIIFSDIAEQNQAEETILRQANYDPLTELPNRRLFLDRLRQELKKVHRGGMLLALLFIDLDRFKEVNDTLGHQLGDELLVEAARRISASVRESDTAARLGGDEFAVILSEMEDSASIDRIVESILHTLIAPFQIGNEKVYLSASIGITLYPNDATKIDDLLKHADQALYVAKSSGRNCSSYFTTTLQQAAESRMRLTNDLRGALEGNQFLVYYQPIVELATGKVHKAEALIRWQHPEFGLVSPTTFIPLAEDIRMIIEIGDWVFKQAAYQVKRLRTMHHPEFQISVNKSPVQFNNDDILYKGWFSHLSDLGLPGSSISIEITEGLLLASATKVTDRLLEFSKAGIQVSLDDFGTGYSSLSYLKKFDIDYLKIDQSFVRDLEVDENDKALCETIIVVAHKLGLKVIAEGVETEGQRKFLTDAGCDYAQGYLFSRPVPSDEFEQLMSKKFS